MTETKKYLSLYYDKGCTQLLPIQAVKGELIWILDFGRLDAGTTKDGVFWVKNTSKDVVEQLEITLGKPDKAHVNTKLITKKDLGNLKPGQSNQVTVQWEADSDVKADRCVASISLKGYIVKEELR